MTECKRCNGLISTADYNHTQKLKPHSLMYVDVCNECATMEDINESIECVKNGTNSYSSTYGYSKYLDLLCRSFVLVKDDRAKGFKQLKSARGI